MYQAIYAVYCRFAWVEQSKVAATFRCEPSVALQEQIWRTERRRSLLLSGLSLFPALLYPQAASAQPKRSLTSDKPCTLTFFNKTRHAIKVYWNNFDADKEFFAMIPPNAEYTVDSFAVSHVIPVTGAFI